MYRNGEVLDKMENKTHTIEITTEELLIILACCTVGTTVIAAGPYRFHGASTLHIDMDDHNKICLMNAVAQLAHIPQIMAGDFRTFKQVHNPEYSDNIYSSGVRAAQLTAKLAAELGMEVVEDIPINLLKRKNLS